MAERLHELALIIYEYAICFVGRAWLTRGPFTKVSIEILHPYNCRLTLNDDVPGLDGDLDPLGDLEQFLGVAISLVSPSPYFLLLLRCGGWWL